MLELGCEAEVVINLLADLQCNKVEIKKTGYNSFGKYKYATLDDILEAIQPYLKKYNCIVVWSEDKHNHDVRVCYDTEEKESDYYIHTDSLLTCRIMFATNPSDYIQTQSHGYGINKNADKTCKATTIGKRYSLINLLSLQQVNDEDTDNDNVDVKAQEKRSGFSFNKNTRNTMAKRTNSDKVI